MDAEDFDDLLAGVDLFEGSSQDSLTPVFASSRGNTSGDGRLQALLGMTEDHHLRENPSASSRVRSNSTPDLYSDQASLIHSLPFRLKNKDPTETPTVLDKINGIFHDIAIDLSSQRNDVAIVINNRTTASAPTFTGSDQIPPTKSRRICFPGKTAEEAWRFTVIIRILELIHEAVGNDVVLSKRDIYYRDPALFGKQAVVDRYIDDIALTFNVPRSRLNITAVAKGLIVGSATFSSRDGATITPSSDREGILIPNVTDILTVDMTAIKWILVLEKEASFRSIAASEFWTEISTEGIMITGKGYPDIATRALLNFLTTPSPRNDFASPPVYGLMDFDPDGLAILSVYKHGSLALAHESEDLRVPQIQWLGLRFEDVRMENGERNVEQGLVSLTPRDRAKAVRMLERSKDGQREEWFEQALQTMLMLNVKAELQVLDLVPDGMLGLLRSKLCYENEME